MKRGVQFCPSSVPQWYKRGGGESARFRQSSAAVPFLHIAVLTIIQGITEFLPVSSSGHLVLVPLVTGWQDQGLVMDVAVHVGTLAAVLVYFSRDLWHMVLGWIGGHWRRHDRRLGRALGFYLIVSAVSGHRCRWRALRDGARGAPRSGCSRLGDDRFRVSALWRRPHRAHGPARRAHVARPRVLDRPLPGARPPFPAPAASGVTMTAARWLGYERPEGGALLHAHVDPGHRGERCGGRLRGLEPGRPHRHRRTQRWPQPCRSSWRSLQ